jgi:hypothetical protein
MSNWNQFNSTPNMLKWNWLTRQYLADLLQPYVARVCQDFLANHSINPLDWPPYSPYLSPIEHLWDEMDRRARGRRNVPATLDQLRANTSRICYSPDSPVHGVDQSIYPSHGILSHSSNNAALNWSRVAGTFRRPLALLSISSHRCSIGDKYGLYGGQSSGLSGL